MILLQLHHPIRIQKHFEHHSHLDQWQRHTGSRQEYPVSIQLSKYHHRHHQIRGIIQGKIHYKYEQRPASLHQAEIVGDPQQNSYSPGIPTETRLD